MIFLVVKGHIMLRFIYHMITVIL